MKQIRNVDLQKIKSLDKLAQQANGYNAVITPYPSLADSLDKRSEATVTTPRRIAYEGDDNYRRELFLDLASRDINWKRAAHLLSVAISCWRHTGQLEKLTEHGYSEDEIEKLRDAFDQVENPVSKLDELSIKGDIALLHPEQMNKLERETLPDEVEIIDFREDERFELPDFNAFTSAGTLVRSLIENMERMEPEKVGIAVSPDSKYRSLIESMLEAEGIPFQRRRKTSESDELRTYINLLRAALSGNRARLRDLRPILNQLNISPSYSDGNKFISSLDGDIKQFKEFFNVLPHLTFSESIEKLEEFGYRSDKAKEILEISSLHDEEIGERTLEKFEHVVRNYSPEDRSEDGILLADPHETPRIDRETVFLVGMDTEWNVEPEEQPWIEDEKIREAHRERINSLMQSGRRQIYMIQEKEMEQPIRPCNPITELLENNPSSFEDISVRRVRPEGFEQGEGFSKEKIDVEIRKIDTLSQSALNKLAQSPRLYYFDRLLPSEDQEAMAKGRLFHDFSEFYVNYPGFVEDMNQSEIHEFFIEKMNPFIEDIDQETLRTEIEIGLNSIKSFIDSKDIDRGAFPDIKSESRNSLIDKFGKELRFNLTELSFDKPELSAEGKIDLAISEMEIADFKSGRKYSKKKKVASSRVQTYEDARFPDFQPVMYLSFLRSRRRGEKLKFTFFHFLHELGDQLRNGSKLEEMQQELVYYPESFDQHKSREDVFENLTSGVAKSNDRRKTLEKMGSEIYQDFMDSHRFPDVWDRKKLMNTDFVQEFEELAKKEVGDYKYVRKGVRSASRKLLKKRQTAYFREDLDLFEEFLAEKVDQVNEYRENDFPINAKIDELPEKDLLIK